MVHAGGRPTDYNEELLIKTKQYIDKCEDTIEIVEDKKIFKVNLPTIEGLAYEIKVNRDTIYEWVKIHEEFSDIIGELQAKQARQLVNCGLSGTYNSTIAKVLLSKHGYREATEIEASINNNPFKELNPDELRKLAGEDGQGTD